MNEIYHVLMMPSKLIGILISWLRDEFGNKFASRKNKAGGNKLRKCDHDSSVVSLVSRPYIHEKDENRARISKDRKLRSEARMLVN